MMLKFLILAGLFTITLANPVKQFDSNVNISRIAGGEDVTIESVPYLVSILRFPFFFCGGVIISDEWVLTAAMCAFSEPEEILIRAGSSKYSYGGSVHIVDKIILNQRLDGISPSPAIALMHLVNVLHFDKTRRPISMFDIDEEPVSGAKAIISGWGKYPAYPVDSLQSVVLDVVSRKECDPFDFWPEKQVICVNHPDGNKGACIDDNGGPLTVDGRLAGIIDSGLHCSPHAPDFYHMPSTHINVAAYRAWIRDKTGI